MGSRLVAAVIAGGEFGLWAVPQEAVADGVDDGEADDEDGDACEDFEAALFGFDGDLAGEARARTRAKV